jgi:hypothetical protein
VRDFGLGLFFETGPNPVLEAGWMIGCDTDIFVHVKEFNGLPVDILFNECFDERNLRISRCPDDSSAALAGNSGCNELAAFSAAAAPAMSLEV